MKRRSRPSRSSRRLAPAACALPAALLLALGACANPVIDSRIEALGEEDPNVEPSEYHRPGQPCVLCHGVYEGAEPLISVGGTIYGTPEERVPVEGARVKLIDAVGASFTAKTNCVGNFFVLKEKYDPLFPLHVEVEYEEPGTGVTKVAVMGTRISRDGSCAGCHTDSKPNQGTPGRVYCTENPPEPFKEPASCPARP